MHRKTSDIANENNHINHARWRSIMTTAALVLSCTLATGLLPLQASAKTIADYDAEIAAQEQVVAEAEAVNQEAQKALGHAAVWYYQNGAPEDLLDIIASSEDFIDSVNKAEYVSRIYQKYADDVAAAREAKQNAEAARAALQALRDEKAARSMSLETAREVQFAQSGMEWSGLPYWTGSVARAGCGLCSYTVIINVLTGSDYTPADMLDVRGDWRGMDGYPDDSTGAHGQSHADFTREKFDIDTYNISHSVSELKEVVSKPEACAMVCAAGTAFKNNSGAWRYSSGHFVAVLGYDEEGFHVSDSAYTYDEGHDVVYSDAEMSRMLSGASHITVYQN